MDENFAASILQQIQLVNQNVLSLRADVTSSSNQLREDVNNKIDELKDQISEHEKKDATYWKKIDERDGQLKLLTALSTGSIGLWAVTWFLEKFGLK